MAIAATPSWSMNFGVRPTMRFISALVSPLAACAKLYTAKNSLYQ